MVKKQQRCQPAVIAETTSTVPPRPTTEPQNMILEDTLW